MAFHKPYARQKVDDRTARAAYPLGLEDNEYADDDDCKRYRETDDRPYRNACRSGHAVHDPPEQKYQPDYAKHRYRCLPEHEF
ncbi:hypothetical protein SDC9_179982 [bioreactor metagenome]|uniref:Uncharacterized protein n=1 Tax=bioreactor metagenome TaxID=1076179 RepID=A0A645H9N5_9ZZZZ